MEASGDRGWALAHLDVEVTLLPALGTLRTEGVVTLRLDGLEWSSHPALMVNTRPTRSGDPAIQFRSVEATDAEIKIDEEVIDGLHVHRAVLELSEARQRGATIDVHFECETVGTVRRMIVHDSAAMADWSNGWLPYTFSKSVESLAFSPALFAVPGRTVLRLPLEWKGLVDGTLLERRETPEEVVEVWETPAGVARSFVAGPYRVATTQADGREYRVYLMNDDESLEPTELAVRLARAIAAEERRFGQFPVASYSIVEFPRIAEQSFGAVSEQTHVIVQPPNFDYAASNIQLFAHEAAHAWWGNAVGTVGPGLKWCSESLAELGALVAIEEVDGELAMRQFLEFSSPGTDAYYCAAGYFDLLRQGRDLPLATMRGEEQTHALANSKGVWVLHMLRNMLGDDVFFGVLRGVAREFRGGVLSVVDLRERFVRAAPGRPVEAFFEQWLDRTGAPIFDLFWHSNPAGDTVLLELSQLQEGGPFTVDLDLDVSLGDGSAQRVRVAIEERTQVFEFETSARPVGVLLDPDRKVLLWRPEYGPRPDREIVAASARTPGAILTAVVGSYRFLGMNKGVDVFARDGVLFMKVEGSAPMRLIHVHDGVFRVDAPGGLRAEFDLTHSPAMSFDSVEGGGTERYPAERVGR